MQSLGAGPVINPFTGAAFTNNTIPSGNCQACINPVALALLKLLPHAQRQATRLTTILTSVPDPSNSNAFDARSITTSIPSSRSIVRYSFKNALYNEFNNAGVVAPANNFLPNDGANEQNRSLVVSYNYVDHSDRW